MTLQSDIFLRPVDCARRLSISPESLKKLERAGIICAYKLPLLEGERRFFWPDVIRAIKNPVGTGMAVGVQIGEVEGIRASGNL